MPLSSLYYLDVYVWGRPAIVMSMACFKTDLNIPLFKHSE